MVKKGDSVQTPPYVIQYLEAEFGKLFDPCPLNPDFDKKKDTDGLAIPWKQFTFVNPPYSNVRPWLEKAAQEHKLGKTIVLLLKVETIATKYFKELSRGAELRFFNHCIVFPGYKHHARFRSVLLVFKAGMNSNTYQVIDCRRG